MLPEEAELLRIYISEQDRYDGHPLSDALVNAAREAGMSGATVLRGQAGFGLASHMHSAKILRLAENLPLVVEIVDTTDKIEAFLPEADRMVGDGLMTVEKVRVVVKRHGSQEKQ